MEKAIKEAGTPNENHKKLQPFTGVWTANVKCFQEGDKPQESTATATSQMIFGGKFLHTKVNGTMFNEPFQGVGTIGYNNLNQKFEYTWIDSAGTATYCSTGSADSEGKVLTFRGEMIDPVSKEKLRTREVWRLISPTRYTIEAYSTGADGKETRMMEITLNKTGDAKEMIEDQGRKLMDGMKGNN